jgi:hypothetical protein
MDMINEIKENWTKIYTISKPKGAISELLLHMPSISQTLIKPDFSVDNLIKILKNKKILP